MVAALSLDMSRGVSRGSLEIKLELSLQEIRRKFWVYLSSI